jgi:acetyltransferase-like isoleucine patch superfamily enzyme
MGIRSYIHRLILSGRDKKNKKIVGLNNQVINNGHINNSKFDIVGNNNKIVIEKSSSINNVLFFIRGDNHLIEIDENCYIGGGELWMEDNNCAIIINSGTTIESAHLAVTEPHSRIEIQDDCMLANNIEIRTGDSHSIIDANTGQKINPAKNVILQSHVWVGAHAKILKGVTISSNSVIGTSSVVTNSIPGNCIAAGIPAKVLKTGTNWKRDRY